MPEDSSMYLSQELFEVQQTLGWMDLVISSIDDAVCVVDHNNKLLFANDYFAQIVDIPRVFLLGQNMDHVLHLNKITNPLAEYRDSLHQISKSIETESGIFDWKNKDGHTLIFRVASRLLPSSDQHVFFIKNITQEYEMTRMKNNFVNLASHQLRTPLTAIMLYSHMLRDNLAGELSVEQHGLAVNIVQATERMNRLVDALLKITRAQSSKSKIDLQLISLETVVKQVFKELEPQIKDKKLVCVMKISKRVTAVHSDPFAIREILSNLVVNAVQYTKNAGTIKVHIKNHTGNVIISVSDTGIGIPKKHQPLLFKQFSRADNALAEYSEGTGLGLYLIKILLEKIGGNITFSSKLHVGTTFTVSIPGSVPE